MKIPSRQEEFSPNIALSTFAEKPLFGENSKYGNDSNAYGNTTCFTVPAPFAPGMINFGNPNKLDPPYLLCLRAEEISGKWVIKIQVPVSSQVHLTGGDVYLRSEDGDFCVSDLNRIAGLVNRKLSFFTEQRVLPFLDMTDLRSDLFDKARRMMRQRSPQHPWPICHPKNYCRSQASFARMSLAARWGTPSHGPDVRYGRYHSERRHRLQV